MNDFMTLEILATLSGLVLAVGIIVQFTKSIIKERFNDVAVRIYTLIISLMLTFIFANNSTGIESIVLTIINSIIVAMTSMGGYEILSDPKANK